MNKTRKKPKKLFKALLTLLLISSLLAFLFVYELWHHFPSKKHPGTGNEVSITIKPGDKPKKIADTLKTNKLIESDWKFALWLRISKEYSKIKAGTFTLKDNLTPRQLVRILSGREDYRGIRITVPEGFRLSQLASLLDQENICSFEEFRKLSFDQSLLQSLKIKHNSLEGYLFPDTYFFFEQTSPEKVVRRMHNNFRQKYKEITKSESIDPDIVTMASIVQAEAQVISEAPKIAGVYYNRLNEKIFPLGLLQADPTVSYGCDSFLPNTPDSCSTFKGILGRKQLDDPKNKFNTYKHRGLPPGPICLPGVKALKAAINPESVPYLFFVATGDGTHRFSKTLEEHNKAVRLWRESRK